VTRIPLDSHPGQAEEKNHEELAETWNMAYKADGIVGFNVPLDTL